MRCDLGDGPATQRADVVVIGGGPAGSTAATLLKLHRPDARVVLVERARFPRHHVGESTLPDANAVLAKLGVLDRIDAAGFGRKGGITYQWRRDRAPFSEDFAKGAVRPRGGEGDGTVAHAWQVERGRYDAILLERAAEVGVEIWQPASVRDITHRDGAVTGVRVRRDESDVEVHAGHVIDASGQARVVARALGLERQPQLLGDVAVYRYYDGVRWDERLFSRPALSRIFFAATPSGWVWLIPLSPTQLSVGWVTRREFLRGADLDALFDAELATVPEALAVLEGATQVRAPHTDGPVRSMRVENWSYTHGTVAGPGWYLAGDAAAFVDPILSSGILLAHRAGLNAANAVITEWEAPECAGEALREAYSDFYRDLCTGFVAMARWWYDQRESGMEDWWRQAGVLARDAGMAGVGDLEAFLTFTAGYLCDHRFERIGSGFGVEGLATCMDGLTGQTASGDRLMPRSRPGSVVLVPSYVGVVPEAYLGTAVHTQRWWSLPALRFTLPGPRESFLYRPPVAFDGDGRPQLDATRRALSALLDACDGERSHADVLRTATQATGAPELVGRLLGDLVAAQLVQLGERQSAVGRHAGSVSDRGAPVRLEEEDAAVVWVRLPWASEERPELCWRGGTRRYRPVGPLGGPVLQAALIEAGRAPTYEAAVRGVRRALGADDAQVNRMANVVLSDLVGLGVVRLSTEPPTGR